jgi:5-(carboxyamino)imidazole ribonucleotide synthase
MVARTPSGTVAAYPPAANHHVDGILAWSVIPGVEDAALAMRARELASAIAEAIGVEGLLCAEMFLSTRGELLVNELAPCPHNSYHESTEGCATSQFEQAVRAICDLPLGSTDSSQPAAIANLLGELWANGAHPDFTPVLASPKTRLHLYGKRSARPGRKMGHLTVTGDTPQAVRGVALQAAQRLGIAPF